MNSKVFIKTICLLSVFIIIAVVVSAEPDPEEIRMEADYIVSCQYINEGHPAHGAINNIYGEPTWVVPRENAMAILGLIIASDILSDEFYLQRANLAADYLVAVQDQTDGAWYNQYNYDQLHPDDLGKSPTQTAEVMIAFYKLGYRDSRYNAMKKGAEFLLACQDPANKLGSDDGLIGGGKDAYGVYHSWRWASDNAYAYLAFRAAEDWARQYGDSSFAQTCLDAANRIIDGINTYLYIDEITSPDYGVWHRVVDMNDTPIDSDFHDWINYAPQMLDIPARGVGSSLIGEWIHQNLQTADGACVWDNTTYSDRKSPGFSFQASLCWLDLGQSAYSDSAETWARESGLWQTEPDGNGVRGGWIDWIDDRGQEDWWNRFIDTSFYAIATFNDGYNFRTWSQIPRTCFLAGTPILMADGSWKPIELVKAGDFVLAYDEQTGSLKEDKIKKIFIHQTDNYLIINSRLKVTPNHLFYSNGKWQEIGALKVGDKLFNYKGKEEEIKSIQRIKADVTVYNLEVNPFHTYIADEFVVHNKNIYYKMRAEPSIPARTD